MRLSPRRNRPNSDGNGNNLPQNLPGRPSLDQVMRAGWAALLGAPAPDTQPNLPEEEADRARVAIDERFAARAFDNLVSPRFRHSATPSPDGGSAVATGRSRDGRQLVQLIDPRGIPDIHPLTPLVHIYTSLQVQVPPEQSGRATERVTYARALDGSAVRRYVRYGYTVVDSQGHEVFEPIPANPTPPTTIRGDEVRAMIPLMAQAFPMGDYQG